LKKDVEDVTFLAIIGENRPDLLDHDDIKKLSSAITAAMTKEGLAPLPPAPKRGRPRKATKANGVKRRARRGVGGRRKRAEYKDATVD
jgi:hypothetical protein